MPFAGVATRSKYVTDYLTLEDIAARLQVSKGTARELTLQPGFPSALVLSCKTLRWPAHEVDQFLSQLRKAPRAARRATERRAPAAGSARAWTRGSGSREAAAPATAPGRRWVTVPSGHRS